MAGNSECARSTKWRLFFIVIVVGSLIVGAGVMWRRQRVRADLQEYLDLLHSPIMNRNLNVPGYRAGSSSSTPAKSNDEFSSYWRQRVSFQQRVVDQLEAIHPRTGTVQRLHSQQVGGLLHVEEYRLSTYETMANGDIETAGRRFGSLAERTEIWHQELAILCNEFDLSRHRWLSDLIY